MQGIICHLKLAADELVVFECVIDMAQRNAQLFARPAQDIDLSSEACLRVTFHVKIDPLLDKLRQPGEFLAIT